MGEEPGKNALFAEKSLTLFALASSRWISSTEGI